MNYEIHFLLLLAINLFYIKAWSHSELDYNPNNYFQPNLYAYYQIDKCDSLKTNLEDCSMENVLLYLKEETKFPRRAKCIGVEGKVYIKIQINEVGKVFHVLIAKGSHPILNLAAKKLIANMRDWTAPIYRNEPVQTQLIIPINYKLE